MRLALGGWKYSVCLLVAAIPRGFVAADESVDYEVFVARPTISNDAVQPGKPLPANWRAENVLRLTACRDEREPASFIIETKQPLREVNIRVSGLRGEPGTLDSGIVDVRVVAPVFRQVSDFPGTLNWVLTHDPNLLIVTDEPEPQAQTAERPAERAYVKSNVFTRDPIDAPTLRPADVKERQQFWITVHVPKNAQPDIYNGSLKIICENAPQKELAIELTVPSFDLLPPKFQYSVYYPAWLEGGELKRGNATNYPVLSESQYLAELRNMAEHGCLNPTIYPSPMGHDRSQPDFVVFDKVLKLREAAGMPRGQPLYICGTGRINSSNKPTDEQQFENIQLTRKLVDWVRKRGYGDVYLMGADEATGEALMSQRGAWQSVHDGGGKIFVAHYAGYTEGIGDLLDLPIMIHPMHSRLDQLNLMPAEEFLKLPEEVLQAISPQLLLAPEYQSIFRRVHEKGFRIFTYMDPLAGYVLPETHRRMRGLQLWKTNLDGTMTWAYTHITDLPPAGRGRISRWPGFNFVLRGKEAPFDTLAWEAYREGYDDARYLATLQAAMGNAKTKQTHLDLVSETERWLENVSVDMDLDKWRREMIQRTTQLLKN